MTVKLAYDPPTKHRRPRQIFIGNRRAKVAELWRDGVAQTEIGKRLGISISTVGRDIKWLKSSEHMARAHEMAEDIVEGELLSKDGSLVLMDSLPTNMEEFRTKEKAAVLRLLAKKQTYRQIADELGCQIGTVFNHVNAHLIEYGDWGGRSNAQWRNEQLIDVDARMVALDSDINMQPVEDGEGGYFLTIAQAARIRKDAMKVYADLMRYKAQLLSLLVQRVEVDVEQKVMVVEMKNVDFDTLRGPTVVQ